MRESPDADPPLLDWLLSHRQTRRTIDRFWGVVLVSALNETVDRVGLVDYGRAIQQSVASGRGPLQIRSFVDSLAQVRGEALEANHSLAARTLLQKQKRRALVCMGAPCRAAGAAVVWGHLRNEQNRLALRTVGEGMMSAKSSCLGPCSLAPVVQMWPEGTIYGGVDEGGIDRIVDRHVLKGEVVEALAYAPTGAKQRLR